MIKDNQIIKITVAPAVYNWYVNLGYNVIVLLVNSDVLNSKTPKILTFQVIRHQLNLKLLLTCLQATSFTSIVATILI